VRALPILTSSFPWPSHTTDMHASFVEDVLDVEASDVDCLYRIARHTSTVTRVMYVTICDASIIPAHERTESSLILRNLRKLPGWTDHDWHTMCSRRRPEYAPRKTGRRRMHSQTTFCSLECPDTTFPTCRFSVGRSIGPHGRALVGGMCS
jgi:hypothetical protein